MRRAVGGNDARKRFGVITLVGYVSGRVLNVVAEYLVDDFHER